MCGIAGVVGSWASQLVDLGEAPPGATLRHRGPDDAGHYVSPGVATSGVQLWHTRLAILDVSPAGHQPMTTPDGRYVIVYNGEIYNHDELRRALVVRYMFRSSSDTETLLAGFAAYGSAVFAKLNGIFACAIFDTHTRTLTLARDHLGVKPLYLYQKDGQFLFASEVKALAQFPGMDRSLDYVALADYLHFLYAPGEQTPFRHVRKLRAGHYVTLSVDRPEQVEERAFYQLPFSGRYVATSEKDLITSLDEHLHRAVERQLLADRPVGFFLSGGLDSSAVVALAKRLRPDERPVCYTIRTDADTRGFEGFSADLPYARHVAKHLGAELVEVDVQTDLVRDFARMVWHLDEPLADTAPFSVWAISQQARDNGHVVLLGGAGGDDLFSGYRRHRALLLENVFRYIPTGVGRYVQQFLEGKAYSPALRRIQKLAAGLALPPNERLAAHYGWLAPARVAGLFSAEIRSKLGSYQPRATFLNALQEIPDERSQLNQMLFWELRYFLPDHNLAYTDRMSMAEGVEARVPLLDIDLVKFSATLPPDLKMRRGVTKYIFRKAMEPYLPRDVIYRPKTGFGSPLRQWLRAGHLDPLFATYLSPDSLRQRGIFDPAAVQQLLADTRAGRIDGTYSLWGLLVMESWLRQYVDAPQLTVTA